MFRWLFLAFLLSASISAFATDVSHNVTKIIKSGHWDVIEFAGATQLIYRIASRSVNFKDANIAFNFAPSKKCDPDAAVLIYYMGSYKAVFDNGVVPIMYRVPGKKASEEAVRTVMERGNGYAFFPFKRLTPNVLLKSEDKGDLAVWIPGSGNGQVKRSGNIYFDLGGFTEAFRKAQTLCSNNR